MILTKILSLCCCGYFNSLDARTCVLMDGCRGHWLGSSQTMITQDYCSFLTLILGMLAYKQIHAGFYLSHFKPQTKT